MKVVGLTGGSGTGKSKIASYFEKQYKAYLIDADQIGHKIIKKGMPAYSLLIKHFGHTILDETKEINRKKLGAMVFMDPEKLKLLNKITHPFIVSKIDETITQCSLQDQQHSFIMIDGALLVEANVHKKVDELWVVYANLDCRIKRLKKRDGLSQDQILQRIEGQMPWETLCQYAHRIIDNSGDFTETMMQCDQIVKDFLGI
ncbi:MAG: dephospho-CoA kinase [Epulopiscium sp.]|nr:dephospho-CoA kinase [Candidatus Epulonipiscium sp.]